ncbi:hypothetical protein ACP4OV_002865 [Aristida adscensionis]
MEPSRENLSKAVVLLLLTLAMATEMGRVQARDCWRQSVRLPGILCVRDDYCAIGCREEGKGYTGGRCLSHLHEYGIRCMCSKPCPDGELA